MNRFLFFFFLLFSTVLVSAVNYQNIDFVLDGVNSDNNYQNIDLVLGEEAPPVDSCTCAGLNTNWEIDLSDYCNITTECDLGYGNITFINNGSVLFNSTLEVYEIDFKDSVAVVEKYNLGSGFRGLVG